MKINGAIVCTYKQVVLVKYFIEGVVLSMVGCCSGVQNLFKQQENLRRKRKFQCNGGSYNTLGNQAHNSWEIDSSD